MSGREMKVLAEQIVRNKNFISHMHRYIDNDPLKSICKIYRRLGHSGSTAYLFKKDHAARKLYL